MSAVRVLLALAAWLLVAPAALACPACADLGNASARWYSNTTVILTATQLAFLGGVVYWVRRKVVRGSDPADQD